MSTNAGQLLEIMRVRHKMQEDGVTNPSEDIKTATKMLVDKLSQIDGTETISVVVSGQTASYMREANGELLAEVHWHGAGTPKFTWGDSVIVVKDRVFGSVCGITESEDGFAYTVEFADGSDALIPERDLIADTE